MASPADIIELNGKRYDARTGHLLSVPSVKIDKPKAKVKKIKVVHKQTPKTSKAHHAVHHRTERAKTLMRQAVKKPEPEHETTERPTVHREPASRLQLDPERLERAQNVAKHRAVSRFGKPAQASLPEQQIKPIITELPMQPEPVPIAPEQEANISTAHSARDSHHSFQHAIDQATSHTEPQAKRPSTTHRMSQKIGVSTRITSLSAAALAAILLVGFVGYQNIPNLSMRIASQRAGVAAQLPGYQPSGFGLSGPIQYRPGQITVQFRSHSDDRQFRLRQTASEWDSAALLKNYLSPEHNTFQVRQTDGKTIYVYDDHNATWVDDGVWYQVEGDSALNSEQLLRLAASF